MMGHYGFLPFSLLVFLSASISDAHTFSAKIGVNYGTLGNNLPPPSKSIELIKNVKAGRVKLYNPEPTILHALQGTDIQVSIMVPNNLICNISSNQTLANDWIKTNFIAYYPQTRIRYLLVGNEILSFNGDEEKQTWLCLVPAMRKLSFALRTFGIRKIKIGTPMAMDVLESTPLLPSNGTFRSDIADSVIKPLLQFLNKTKSFFFIDCYPYFVWSENYPNITLDYALFNQGTEYKDPVSQLTYTNLLDQMLDSIFFAMKKLGFPDTRLWISETGWPNGCDVDQFGGNVYNAATYNRNLVKKLTSKPPLGTPARPGAVLPSFIFSLFNENQKGGPGTERHWGMFYPNQTSIYPIDLSGGTHELYYPPLPEGNNNEPYKGKIWCVVAQGVNNNTALASAVTYACSQGNGTCDAIKPGKACYGKKNDMVSQANYAFSAYWSQFKSLGGTCFFDGLAEQTSQDPSHGYCKFPSVTVA